MPADDYKKVLVLVNPTVGLHSLYSFNTVQEESKNIIKNRIRRLGWATINLEMKRLKIRPEETKPVDIELIVASTVELKPLMNKTNKNEIIEALEALRKKDYNTYDLMVYVRNDEIFITDENLIKAKGWPYNFDPKLIKFSNLPIGESNLSPLASDDSEMSTDVSNPLSSSEKLSRASTSEEIKTTPISLIQHVESFNSSASDPINLSRTMEPKKFSSPDDSSIPIAHVGSSETIQLPESDLPSDKSSAKIAAEVTTLINSFLPIDRFSTQDILDLVNYLNNDSEKIWIKISEILREPNHPNRNILLPIEKKITEYLEQHQFDKKEKDRPKFPSTKLGCFPTVKTVPLYSQNPFKYIMKPEVQKALAAIVEKESKQGEKTAKIDNKNSYHNLLKPR